MPSDATQAIGTVVIRLAPDELFSFQLQGYARLTCLTGTLWLTLEPDPLDYVLESGDLFAREGDGKIVVQALYDSATLLLASGY